MGYPDEMMRMNHRDVGDNDINDPWRLPHGTGWKFLGCRLTMDIKLMKRSPLLCRACRS